MGSVEVGIATWAKQLATDDPSNQKAAIDGVQEDIFHGAVAVSRRQLFGSLKPNKRLGFCLGQRNQLFVRTSK